MKATIVALCILSSGLLVRAQLNYEGNPLTESIEYTAQESQSSRLNAGRNYERFEVTDGKARDSSKIPFTPSAVDPLLSAKSKQTDEKLTENIPTTKNIPLLKDEPNIQQKTLPTAEKSVKISDISASGPTKENPIPLSNIPVESHAEARQLRGYPIQETSQGFQQTSPVYVQQEVIPGPRNVMQQPQPVMSQSEALSKFLSSKTPEESEMALSSYLLTQQNQNKAQERNFQEPEIQKKNVPEVIDTLENEIPTYETLQRQSDVQNLPIAVGDTGVPIPYSPRFPYGNQAQTLHAASRWSQFGPQLRYDPTRRYPGYRSSMRYRTPWAQSRLGPGPIYHSKGPGPWKTPVEVIYTKPPGPTVPHVISNPPVHYEDASKYFPDSDHLPPQKDVYYSQLWAQSYDPHYYNYIAKTGKIKPWLYGKLGKNEEKSIWWDLYTGFKNNGLKNMMHPMFLLGMSIPTLTLMLSALIQKRSLGRSDGSSYSPREFIQKYEPQIRAAILAYENQIKDKMSLGEMRRQKRSTEDYDDDEEDEEFDENVFGPNRWQAELSVPSTQFFLQNQEHFAAAIKAQEITELAKERHEKNGGKGDVVIDDDLFKGYPGKKSFIEEVKKMVIANLAQEKLVKEEDDEEENDEVKEDKETKIQDGNQENQSGENKRTPEKSIFPKEVDKKNEQKEIKGNLDNPDRWQAELQVPSSLFFLPNQEHFAGAIMAQKITEAAKKRHKENGGKGDVVIDDDLFKGYPQKKSFIEEIKKMVIANLAQEKLLKEEDHEEENDEVKEDKETKIEDGNQENQSGKNETTRKKWFFDEGGDDDDEDDKKGIAANLDNPERWKAELSNPWNVFFLQNQEHFAAGIKAQEITELAKERHKENGGKGDVVIDDDLFRGYPGKKSFIEEVKKMVIANLAQEKLLKEKDDEEENDEVKEDKGIKIEDGNQENQSGKNKRTPKQWFFEEDDDEEDDEEDKKKEIDANLDDPERWQAELSDPWTVFFLMNQEYYAWALSGYPIFPRTSKNYDERSKSGDPIIDDEFLKKLAYGKGFLRKIKKLAEKELAQEKIQQQLLRREKKMAVEEKEMKKTNETKIEEHNKNQEKDETNVSQHKTEERKEFAEDLFGPNRWQAELQDPSTLFFLQNEEYFATSMAAYDVAQRAKRRHQEKGGQGDVTIDDDLLDRLPQGNDFHVKVKKLAEQYLAEEKQVAKEQEDKKKNNGTKINEGNAENESEKNQNTNQTKDKINVDEKNRWEAELQDPSTQLFLQNQENFAAAIAAQEFTKKAKNRHKQNGGIGDVIVDDALFEGYPGTKRFIEKVKQMIEVNLAEEKFLEEQKKGSEENVTEKPEEIKKNETITQEESKEVQSDKKTDKIDTNDKISLDTKKKRSINWEAELQDPFTVFFLQNEEYFAASMSAYDVLSRAKRRHKEKGGKGDVTVDDDLLEHISRGNNFRLKVKKLVEYYLAEEKQIAKEQEEMKNNNGTTMNEGNNENGSGNNQNVNETEDENNPGQAEPEDPEIERFLQNQEKIAVTLAAQEFTKKAKDRHRQNGGIGDVIVDDALFEGYPSTKKFLAKVKKMVEANLAAENANEKARESERNRMKTGKR